MASLQATRRAPRTWRCRRSVFLSLDHATLSQVAALDSTTNVKAPTVSIGVPCYNRPDTMEQCLTSLRRQSFKDIEILISDDASPNQRVSQIAEQHALDDPRVRFVRQRSNIGMIPNFEFVLANTSGHYFMWSSDDDWWESDMLARRLEKFYGEGNGVVTVSSETVYETPEGSYDFFTEGDAFRSFRSDSVAERFEHLAENIYGILMYGLHRRDALFYDDHSIFHWFGKSYNEYSAILMLAARGDIVTLREVGLHKRAPASCAAEQRWVAHGGKLPKSLWSRTKRQFKNVRYHISSYRDCQLALNALGLDQQTRVRVDAAVQKALLRGAWDSAIGWRTPKD